MSSIYDALQRIQEQKLFSQSDGVVEDSHPKRRIFWVVFIAVIMSSVCTAAVFYGVKVMKDGTGEIENITVSQGPSGSEGVVSVSMQDDLLQNMEDADGSTKALAQLLRRCTPYHRLSCHKNLIKWSCPREIEFRDALPLLD